MLSDVYGPTIDNDQRRDAAVRRHRRLDLHRPADPRHDLHGPHDRPDRDGLRGDQHAAARRLPAGHRLPDRPGAQHASSCTRSLTGSTAGPEALRPATTRRVNGNGGGGHRTTAAPTTPSVDPATTALVVVRHRPTTNAVNRDYAGPVFAALRADRPFLAASSGYVGTGPRRADPARRRPTRLDGDHADRAGRQRRADRAARPRRARGSVDAGARLRRRPRPQAIGTAGASATASFGATPAAYEPTWRSYDEGLTPPPASLPGLTARAGRASRRGVLAVGQRAQGERGQDVPGRGRRLAGQPVGPGGQRRRRCPSGKPVYFGSLPRGLLPRPVRGVHRLPGRRRPRRPPGPRRASCSSASSWPTAGCRATRCSTGSRRPDTGGDQLDETAYPILMAWQSGLAGDNALWTAPHQEGGRLRGRARPVVRRRSAGRSRAATRPRPSPPRSPAWSRPAAIADEHGDHASARVYRATADHFQRWIKGWTVTTTGPYGAGRYFIRLSKTGDPNAGDHLQPRQRSARRRPARGRRRRLPRADPARRAAGRTTRTSPPRSPVVDSTISATTPSGPGFYRYGTSTAGTEDGYGDCYEPDPTDLHADRPAVADNGHRLRSPVAGAGRRAGRAGPVRPATPTGASTPAADDGRDRPPASAWCPSRPGRTRTCAASPYGTDPTTASIGFADGQAAGSASPLTWAQAQEVRLIPVARRRHGRSSSRPSSPPATSHGSAPALAGRRSPRRPTARRSTTATVDGDRHRRRPGAQVDVAVDADRHRRRRRSPARPSRAPAAPARSTVPARARHQRGHRRPRPTGTAHRLRPARPSSSTFVTGTAVLDVDRPGRRRQRAGHLRSTRPSPNFHAGRLRPRAVPGHRRTATRRRACGPTLRDLTPTFGSPLGAQLLDVFVHDPAATPTSTAAAVRQPQLQRSRPTRPWSQRVEVQGFADPVYVDAAGQRSLGRRRCTASQAARTITDRCCRVGALGTPAPGLEVRRGPARPGRLLAATRPGPSPPTPQDYSFGVCAAGRLEPDLRRRLPARCPR